MNVTGDRVRLVGGTSADLYAGRDVDAIGIPRFDLDAAVHTRVYGQWLARRLETQLADFAVPSAGRPIAPRGFTASQQPFLVAFLGSERCERKDECATGEIGRASC